jgi:acetoacetyl-CoA reductase
MKNNKIALITGGVGDIGTAICHQLAKQGAKVIATYYPKAMAQEQAEQWQAEQLQLGYDISVRALDVTQFDNCQTVLAEIENDIGGVAILINNAGINRDAQLKKMSPEQWQQVLHTDLDGLFNVTRNLINPMIERNYGRIVNISSVNGLKGQFGQTNYSAAKAGVHGFTKSLALEVARKGITVNTISPGYVESHMVMSIAEPIREKIIEQIPVGRLAQPGEIARMIAFLVAEDSAYITGANFSVNGGLHMY